MVDEHRDDETKPQGPSDGTWTLIVRAAGAPQGTDETAALASVHDTLDQLERRRERTALL